MSTQAERYARVHAIFDGARGLEGAERSAFLGKRCGTDVELRREVEQLLASLEYEGPDAFSEAGIAAARRSLEVLVPAATSEVNSDPTWLPDNIGGYHIQRLIGEGGMGVVYEALQESPRRRVAIKLLPPHQTSAERLRRFRQEAELLGRLQHPGIAQIYEAGTFDLGRGAQPFFAMELIDGIGIRSFVERENLDVPARLALLAQVADGVHHAHERGVIHRDLKPDNVLVDESGRPIILDFGVARAKESSDVLSTMGTEDGVLLGTLAYMAPEQLAGDADAITPSVDVYALGVLAFELLSGRLPHEVAGLPFPAAMRVLSEEPCRRLSTLVPTLRGDVETIVSTALSHEAKRRYPSAAALSADIRRYLEHLPIAARPTSHFYRARKYARRHRSLVGGAVVLGIAALVSLLFAAFAARERDASEQALENLSSVVEELAQPFPVATRFLKESDGGSRTLLHGEQLTKGDRVTLEVRSLIELNLYVFNQDDSGVVSQIFPIEGLQPQNPLAPERRYLLPGQLGSAQISWTVNSAGGTERFLMLGLPIGVQFDRSDWDLQREIRPAPSAQSDADDVRGLGTDPQSDAAPALAIGNHPLSAFGVLRDKMKQFGNGWVRVVEFKSGL